MVCFSVGLTFRLIDEKRFVKEDEIDRHQHGAYDHADIRHVEDRKINEDRFDEIHDVAEEYAVDHVADGTCEDHGKGKAEKKVQFAIAIENDGHNNESDGRDDEEDPAMLAEHTPSRAVIMDIRKRKKLWDHGDGLIKEHISRDKDFRELIEDDQRRDDDTPKDHSYPPNMDFET